MFIDKSRKGLVRGTVTISQQHGAYEPITAYTFWYRDDEPDLEIVLQRTMDSIMKCYLKEHWRCGTILVGIEWMDYIA